MEETLRLYALAIDHGLTASQARALRELNPLADVEWMEFERLALTPAQIEEYDLPVRPPKASDVRTAKFAGRGAVEVEALPVEVLLSIVTSAILDLIDPAGLHIAEEAERSEREIAERIAATPVQRLLEAAS